MKHKPTTGDMMVAFVECYIPGSDVREMSALFDEWIADVRAKAWDEGAASVGVEVRPDPKAFEAIMRNMQVRTKIPANPYRAAEIRERKSE